MRLAVSFSRGALIDLDEAYAYYEEQQSGLGEAFLEEVERVVERVREYPEVYQRVRREVRRGKTDRFPYGVAYRVKDGAIEVVAVLHLHRDPKHWNERLN